MKLLHVHNHYRHVGGEDVMFQHLVRLLRARGHTVLTFEKHSSGIAGPAGKLAAFFSGLYSLRSEQQARRILLRQKPDVVHVHNLFPLISGSVLRLCRRCGVPVVMRVPDYRFTCPTNWHFNGGVCEACVGGREYRCVVKNCRGRLAESVAYAARAAWLRLSGLIRRNVQYFVSPSHFVRRRLLEVGFPPERVVVIPNMTEVPEEPARPERGRYCVYVGRVSPEKGTAIAVEVARRTGIPLHIAGDWSRMPHLVRSAPPHVTFLGALNREQLRGLYQGARLAVVPTVGLEAFGIVVLEALSYGLPVVASRVGGIPEIIRDGVCGYLCEAGDLDAFEKRMRQLWFDSEACVRMGSAGRRLVCLEYDEEAYYGQLMRLYARALGAAA